MVPRISDAGKLKQVELRGFVPNSAARALMGQSKALILPTQWYEGFPMTIVEAFSAATPVICSDLGNAGSLISDGVTGFKFRRTRRNSWHRRSIGCSTRNPSARAR